MKEIEQLRADAARDRHLARVERIPSRKGVSPTVVDRLAAVVDAQVGADDSEIQLAVSSRPLNDPRQAGERLQRCPRGCHRAGPVADPV